MERRYLRLAQSSPVDKVGNEDKMIPYPNMRDKTDEERTIDKLCKEIEILSKMYDDAAGYYFGWGIATMCIIFLAVYVIMRLLN